MFQELGNHLLVLRQVLKSVPSRHFRVVIRFACVRNCIVINNNYIIYVVNINILLDVLVNNIAVYFYEFCSIKCKERVKMFSDIVQQNIS